MAIEVCCDSEKMVADKLLEPFPIKDCQFSFFFFFFNTCTGLVVGSLAVEQVRVNLVRYRL